MNERFSVPRGSRDDRRKWLLEEVVEEMLYTGNTKKAKTLYSAYKGANVDENLLEMYHESMDKKDYVGAYESAQLLMDYSSKYKQEAAFAYFTEKVGEKNYEYAKQSWELLYEEQNYSINIPKDRESELTEMVKEVIRETQPAWYENIVASMKPLDLDWHDKYVADYRNKQAKKNEKKEQERWNEIEHKRNYGVTLSDYRDDWNEADG